MFARTTKHVMMLALVLGLAAAGLTWYYMTQVVEAAAPTERVVVAKKDIPARTVVSEDMLAYQNMPKGARHPEALSSMGPFVGKAVKQSLTAGEQVLTTKFLQDRKESGLAYAIPEGRRALSVKVDEYNAAGGLIATGDRVDVLGVCVVPAADLTASRADLTASRAELTKLVFALQNMEVLAVAQKVLGEETTPSALDTVKPKSASSSTSLSTTRQAAQQATAKTVTMALTPREAQSIVLLESNPSCSLRLALRSTNDVTVVPMPESAFNPLLPLAGQVQQ